MKIIDIHTHIYPQAIARKATDSVRDFYDLTGSAIPMDGTPELLLQRGKTAGISRFAVLPVAIQPERTQGINDFIRQQANLHPEFVGFGTVHAAMENPADEIARVLAMDLKGIKLHPDSQRFAIDDLRLFPVYEAMQGRLPLILHMGDHRFNYSHPIKLHRILQLFPGLQVIAAHFGGYSMYAEAYEILKDTSCYFDISSALMFLPEGEAERYIRHYGAERMAFGSDYPLWDPVVEVERFRQLKLTPQEMEQIAWKTASRLLRLE